MIKKIIFFLVPIIAISCKVQRVPKSAPSAGKSYVSFERKDYINKFKNLAIKEMNRSSIPASITLAQALLESDDGNSTLAVKGNNHFGIKCHSGWSGGKMYHDDDRRNECFRKYRSVYESYKDHSEFIVNGNRYKFLFNLNPDDYKSWARGLQKAGYATSRTYAAMLIKIIENNQLYTFDKGGSLSGAGTSEYVADSQEVVLGDVDNFTIYHDKHKVYTKNRIDYIIVKKGETLRSLTAELEMLSWELYKYNELKQTAKLVEGQILFIQPKRNMAGHGFDFHFVKKGESVYSISQMYGIKVNRLYEKNLMEKDEQPKVGQKLWLRKLKPHSEVIKETPIIKEFDKN